MLALNLFNAIRHGVLLPGDRLSVNALRRTFGGNTSKAVAAMLGLRLRDLVERRGLRRTRVAVPEGVTPSERTAALAFEALEKAGLITIDRGTAELTE